MRSTTLPPIRMVGLLVALTMSSAISVVAQEKERHYFDRDWKRCSKSDAVYYREWERSGDTAYRVFDYFLSGRIQMEALCTNYEDELAHIAQRRLYYEDGTPEYVTDYDAGMRHGRHRGWHPNGKPSVEGTYDRGQQTGRWTWWNPKGTMTSTGTYEKDRMHGQWRWFDSVGRKETESQYVEGTVVERKTFYTSGRIQGESRTDKSGILTQTWYDTTGTVCGIERSMNDRFIFTKYINEDGTTHNDRERAWVAPMYGGSKEATLAYLRRSVVYPPEAGRKGIQGLVVVKVTIESDGTLADASIAKSAHRLLDEEALRVVRTMTKWSPGIAHNRPARVSFELPFPFGTGE